ncbi:MAG: hypothetical protein Q8904_11010 [Bacteroidota bacterium]|nr:hypothetical protein [Bacteroidota bacterium]
MEEKFNLTLPEWAFLNGNSHLGDTLEGRDVLQHIPTYTLMELFLINENTIEVDSTVKTKEFTYTNIFGETEIHLIAVHFSLAADAELDEIVDKAIEFYKLFMDWEDNSLIIEETSKDN